MSPLHFKYLLTAFLGFGVVSQVLGQGFSLWTFSRGLTTKVTLNVGWIINSVLIYGIWHWL